MIFDTFLNRFELRTGCFVIAILYMCFIIFSLHVPLVFNFGSDYVFALLTTIEKLIETLVTLVLIYAIFQRNRKLMLAWQVIAPLIFLFNIGHIIYLSFLLNNLRMLFALVVSMYLITYMLMLVNSYYDELLYLEDFMCEVTYIRPEHFQIHTHSVSINTEDESIVKIPRRTRI